MSNSQHKFFSTNSVNKVIMRDNWHSLIIIALSGHLDESLMFWIVNENYHLEVIEQLLTDTISNLIMVKLDSFY